MRLKTLSTGMISALAFLAAILLVTGMRASAQTEKVLHSFNGIYGDGVIAGLIFDPAGNLYGTTISGGPDNAGLVFELSPHAGGGWTEKILHAFKNDGKDGIDPWGTLILDAAGNLYGTTPYGGSHCLPLGCGTVFELTPTASGAWCEKILHNFNNDGHDGNGPLAGVTFDSAGNLYGTTAGGGKGYGGLAGGTVFKLTPTTGGWTEKVLFSFPGNYFDASIPGGSLVLDAAGNLYGTASNGGRLHNSTGEVFELSPTASGPWTERVLYTFFRFTGSGTTPDAGLIQDASGNLYGTTQGDNAVEPTTVFELVRQSGGAWTFKVLSKFLGKGNARKIMSGLVFDAAGNLYGTSLLGGVNNNCPTNPGQPPVSCGTVFKLTPEAGGVWTEKLLHSFSDNGKDGFWPQAGLVLDGAGNLYGTTYVGGVLSSCKPSPTFGCGTVFEVTP